MTYIYNMTVTFKETSIFTKRIVELMSDEQYCQLQTALINNPTIGSVIKGSGGLRKIRWGVKNEQEDLTTEQVKLLKAVIKE